MKELTPTQLKMLIFIDTHNEKYSRPVTRTKIAEHMNYKYPSGCTEVLKLLASKECIRPISSINRSIRITSTGHAIAWAAKSEQGAVA